MDLYRAISWTSSNACCEVSFFPVSVVKYLGIRFCSLPHGRHYWLSTSNEPLHFFFTHHESRERYQSPTPEKSAHSHLWTFYNISVINMMIKYKVLLLLLRSIPHPWDHDFGDISSIGVKVMVKNVYRSELQNGRKQSYLFAYFNLHF